MNISDINYLFALGTVLLQIGTVLLLIAFVMRTRVVGFAQVSELVGNWGLWVGFLVATFSTVLTVYYSDVLGFEPCYWCYWQRIFLFPQVVLLGMAAWKKDPYIADYALILSFVGGLVALYHHVMQMLPGSGLPCPATGVSCAQRIFFEFNYITFPLMAVTVFAFLIVLMLHVRSVRAHEMHS